MDVSGGNFNGIIQKKNVNLQAKDNHEHEDVQLSEQECGIYLRYSEIQENAIQENQSL